MEEVQAVAHVVAAEVFEGFHDLGDEEAELGADAAGLLPAASAFGGEFHADADGRFDVVELGVFDDELQLAELLDHGDDVLADLGREDDGFDEFIVLEAVADDGGFVVAYQGHHREQLGLGTGFDTEAVFAAEVEDLLDDVALLVDLDGVDATVEALVVVLADGVGEGFVDAGDAVFEDVGEADQHGRLDVALAELVDEFFEVDLAIFVGVGVDGDGAFGGDGEVSLAPVVDAVSSGGIGGSPRRGGRRRLDGGRRSECGGDWRAVSRAVMPVGRNRLHGGSHRGARDRYVSAHFFCFPPRPRVGPQQCVGIIHRLQDLVRHFLFFSTEFPPSHEWDQKRGCCWVRQWIAPRPQISTTQSMPMTWWSGSAF